MHRYVVFFLALIIGLSVALGSMATANPSNKWRVEVSESAKSDGTIVFEFAPEGAPAFQVTIEIVDGTSENHVAQAISKSLDKQLPAGQYHVEVDDGEDVLIKKASGVADFDLRVISNSVKSVRLNVNRE